jgi:hypothetical protein
MPLHDLSSDLQRCAVHTFWTTEIARWLKMRLPEGYRSFVGTIPIVVVDLPGNPDVGVIAKVARSGDVPLNGNANHIEAEYIEAENEVAVAALASEPYVFVEQHGRLVSVVELISPRNKDRPASRSAATTRYTAHLKNGIHLMLIDSLPKPKGFSFADAIAAELEIPNHQPLSCPHAISYRVGEQSGEGGRQLGTWRRQLQPGAPLGTVPLPLNTRQQVVVDLEATYSRATADAYLD